MNGIVLEDTSKYTDESAKAYLDAYQVLKDILNDLDNVSAEEFNAALEAFEQAEKALVLKADADKEEPGKNEPDEEQKAVATGDDFSVIPAALLLLCAAAGILAFRKKIQR